MKKFVILIMVSMLLFAACACRKDKKEEHSPAPSSSPFSEEEHDHEHNDDNELIEPDDGIIDPGDKDEPLPTPDLLPDEAAGDGGNILPDMKLK